MIIVRPYQHIHSRVRLILNDVFKLSRWLGTFPIDKEYSSVSKLYLATGVVLYSVTTFIAITSLYTIVNSKDVSLSTTITESIKIIPNTILHWTNIACLIYNRKLAKVLHDELEDIEYQFWKSGTELFYKASWFTKYLSPVTMFINGIIWEVYYEKIGTFLTRIPNHITFVALFTITSQYLALLQICLSLLKMIRRFEDSETVIKLSDKVLSLCHVVNSLYETQFLLYIVNIFAVILAVVYKGIVENMPIYIGTVFWKLSLACPLALVILHVRYISDEVN